MATFETVAVNFLWPASGLWINYCTHTLNFFFLYYYRYTLKQRIYFLGEVLEVKCQPFLVFGDFLIDSSLKIMLFADLP